MNPIDVYKKLPRNNCGKCPASTCMSFAVQFLRRMIALSECPEVDDASKKEIKAMLSREGDWKERRLEELFDEIADLDFSDIADQLGTEADGDKLNIKYMGRKISLSHTNVGEDLDILDKLLILIYVKRAGKSPLTGKWVAFRELKDGIVRSESFNGACELAIAGMFERDGQGLLDKMNILGAREVSGYSAPHSFVMYPLPKVPFLLLLWPGDEEFGAECKILFDSTADEYLDVETLLYLGIALVRALGAGH